MRVGIDFGTSNTSVAILTENGPELVELEPGLTSIPTAIFYETGSRGFEIGTTAIETYEAGEDGRLMRSIKSVLGSELVDETTQLGSRAIPFRQVVQDFLKALLAVVERQTGEKITTVTQGRPVSFNDTDKDRDANAQRVLGECLNANGVTDITFLAEPIAAARTMGGSHADDRIAFVVDIGGGTSDFCAVRLSGSDAGFEVLGSSGVYVGGNDFDRLLSFFEITPLFGRTETLELNGLPAPASNYVLLSDWKRHNLLYSPLVKKEIAWMRKYSPASQGIRAFEYLVENFEAGIYARNTEAAKIALSDADTSTFSYDMPCATLSKDLARADFEGLMADSLASMNAAAQTCLADAQCPSESVTDIVMVGGSTFVPSVENLFLSQFPNAKISRNDRFGAVAKGLALHGA